MESLYPLFPLPVVVFPGSPIPLHIFEPRYKEMIGECLEHGRDFGIVLQLGRHLFSVGTAVRIENVLKRFPDGRMNILCLGKRRFRIRALDEQKAYLRGQVEFFDDAVCEDPDLPRLAREGLEALDDFSRLTGKNARSELFDNFDPPALSFLLAEIVPFELRWRQEILENADCAERLRKAVQGLRHYVEQLRLSRTLQRLLHQNENFDNILN